MNQEQKTTNVIDSDQECLIQRYLRDLEANNFVPLFEDCVYASDIVALYHLFKYVLDTDVYLPDNKQTEYESCIKSADDIAAIAKQWPELGIHSVPGYFSIVGTTKDNIYISYFAENRLDYSHKIVTSSCSMETKLQCLDSNTASRVQIYLNSYAKAELSDPVLISNIGNTIFFDTKVDLNDKTSEEIVTLIDHLSQTLITLRDMGIREHDNYIKQIKIEMTAFERDYYDNLNASVSTIPNCVKVVSH